MKPGTNSSTKSVLLQPDVHTALRARWQEGNVRALVDRACREWLARLGVEGVTVPPERDQGATTLDVQGTTGGKATVETTAPTPMRGAVGRSGAVVVQDASTDPPHPQQSTQENATCKKCGHLKTQHWSRGCVAGCVCTEARFQKR